MLSYYSIILILSVWACSSQAAPTYSSLVSEDNLKIMEQVAAQTSKLLLDSLFQSNENTAEARQKINSHYSDLVSKFLSPTYSPKGRFPSPNFVTGLPRKTEKAEKQQNSEFTVPNIDDIIRNALTLRSNPSDKLQNAATTQMFDDVLRKLLNSWNRQQPNNQYTTQAPTWSPSTTSYYSWIKELLENE